MIFVEDNRLEYMDIREFGEKLKNTLVKSEISFDEPMKKHTTFRVGGNADIYVSVADGELRDVLALCNEAKIPFTVIGNGSNILVGDGGIRGVVIEMGNLYAGIEVLDETPEGEVFVGACAGAMLSSLSSFAASRGLTGLEFASGIPGTVGGAVTMNAGAYGGEIKDVIVEAQCMDPATGERVFLKRDELNLGYRHSVVMERPIIVTSAEFLLKKGDKAEIEAHIEDIKQKRIEKQPLNFPSAGSTFKRPEGYFAGKLIEDAGLKGFSVGGAEVSEKHAGFVINKGGATAADIRALIEAVSDRVFEASGVRLEPEVRFVGMFN